MTIDKTKLRSLLNDLERVTEGIRALLSGDPSEIPWPANTVSQKDALLAAGKCISCKMPKKSKLIRGTCSSCQTIRSREAIDEKLLMSLNLLLPRRTPGRKQVIGPMDHAILRILNSSEPSTSS